MTSIAKLKDRARKHEQKEDWAAAIRAYQQVLETEQGQDEVDLELGLFNRIGDLYLRLGQTDDAVSYYETAADKYAEAGFFNNAIALCNKALRHRPNRAPLYLKLSNLCAEQGFFTDARRWILEYAERQLKAGNVDAAMAGLGEFADLSDDPEIRELLAQHLAAHQRPDEAVEQLRLAYAQWRSAGDEQAADRVAADARTIDPDADFSHDELPGLPEPTHDELPGLPEPDVPLEVEPTRVAPEEPAMDDDHGVAGLETHAEEPVGETGAGLEGLETTSAASIGEETAEDAELEGLEVSHAEQETISPDQAEAGTIGDLETFDTGAATEDEEELEEDGDLEEEEDLDEEEELEEEELEEEELEEEELEEDEPEPLPFLDTGYEEEPERDEEPGWDEPAAAGPDDEDEFGYGEEEEPEPLPLLGEEDQSIAAGEPVEGVVEESVEDGAGHEAAEDRPWESTGEPAGGYEAEEPVPGSGVAEEPVPESGVVEEPVGSPTAEAEPEDEGLLDLRPGGAGEGPAEESGEEPADIFDMASLANAAPWQDEDQPTAGGDMDLGTLDLGLDSGPVEETVEDLDVEAVLDRARQLVSRGLMAEAMRELRLLSGSPAARGTFEDALMIVNEVVRHDANNVEALQRRVEYAARIGERDLLVGAYIDLADALARLGAEVKAHAMYERVLGLDPGNEEAREALGVTAEEEEAVDLTELLREEDGAGPEPGAEREPGAEETDPEVAAMLSQFKAKVTERVGADEAGDHYDLGLAFKEMGLIDEAIAEFQTALTGGTERLKVYEELGQCFILNGQYTVALKVLNRALQVPHAGESELLGVYYHLGQCYEELGRRAEAREVYEKVLAIDETFADVPSRVARL